MHGISHYRAFGIQRESLPRPTEELMAILKKGRFAHVRITAAKDATLYQERKPFEILSVGEVGLPDKPFWYSRLDEVIDELEQLPDPFIDRATLELTLGIGRRRAQQILQPLVSRTIGKSGLATKKDVVSHLRRLAAGDAAGYEKQRRQRLQSILNELHQRAKEQPRVLVEAPSRVVNQELESLPPGIHLSPGRIQIEGFRTSDEAKQKLLALILAMGNDPEGFDSRITVSE
jgi:hypothetical protein